MSLHLNPINTKKIQELSDKLHTEEVKARNFYINLEPQLKEMVASGSIDDYNIVEELHVFSYNKAVCQKYSVEVGDPIYSEWVVLNRDDQDFFQNWNENTGDKNNPLARFHFGYVMHCILFHSHLSLEDILEIDDVWIEIKVDYQFWTDKS